MSKGDATIHTGVFRDRRKAVKDLVRYMKTQEGYRGPGDLPSICGWIAEHNERLGVDVFPASVNLG